MNERWVDNRNSDLEKLEASSESVAYKHPYYNHSFEEFGKPIQLPNSKGWLLVRSIPGTAYQDAMGTYPIFCCENWDLLRDDLKDLPEDLVSIVVVTDPFGQYSRATLEASFDNVRKFKDHFVLDLTVPLDKSVSKSHRSAARSALRKLQIRIVNDPIECIDTWMELYVGMVQKLNISGIRKVSRESIEYQFKTPGAMLFEAKVGDQVVGLDMIFIDNDVAYGHLCAFNELGYKLKASYATRWRMIEYLIDKVRFLDFGGGLVTKSQSPSDGLTSYKRRWTSETKPVFICSSIINHEVYERLTSQAGMATTSFFPAYRGGEYLLLT